MSSKQISRNNLEYAGDGPPKGYIGTPLQTFCKVNGTYNISILNEKVASHGTSPHTENKIITASSFCTINSIGIVREGDSAQCGDYVTINTDIPPTFLLTITGL